MSTNHSREIQKVLVTMIEHGTEGEQAVARMLSATILAQGHPAFPPLLLQGATEVLLRPVPTERLHDFLHNQDEMLALVIKLLKHRPDAPACVLRMGKEGEMDS